MIKRVCVYCASSAQIHADYLSAAYELGKVLAQNNIETVYGGGSVGSMGHLANGVIDHKGILIGVIPQFMMELEWGNPMVSEMIVVTTMSERKNRFLENVDAVVALPGGTGTLEELAEVLSLKKLGLFVKPIIILNTNGFYNFLLEFFNKMVEDNFIRAEHNTIYSVAETPHEVIEKIRLSPTWGHNAINLAAL